MIRCAFLVGGALVWAAAAAVADGFPQRISLGDGAFTLQPEGYLQVDAGVPFLRSQPDVTSGGTNDRRAVGRGRHHSP